MGGCSMGIYEDWQLSRSVVGALRVSCRLLVRGLLHSLEALTGARYELPSVLLIAGS